MPVAEQKQRRQVTDPILPREPGVCLGIEVQAAGGSSSKKRRIDTS